MADTDGDGVNDGVDVFPLNKNEWLDSDADGEGDNQDWNDDNDYYADAVENYGKANNLYNLNSKVYDHYEWPISSIDVNPNLPVNPSLSESQSLLLEPLDVSKASEKPSPSLSPEGLSFQSLESVPL